VSIKHTIMKKLLKWVAIIFISFIAFMLIVGIFIESDKKPSQVNEKIKPEYGWTYKSDKDPMTDKERFFATTRSLNMFQFDFPYEGGSFLYLTIRKMNGKDEVILKIDKGQFGNSYTNNVEIRFDENNPISYSFNTAADGSSDYIFLSSSKQI